MKKPKLAKKLLGTFTLWALSQSIVLSIGGAWGNDFEKAKSQAQKEGKDLLLEFTGSDWCPPCMALEKTITGEKSFQDDASKHFVLVAFDYPQTKKLPPELAEQNQKLAGKYKIESFPTLLLCDGTGLPYAKTGFQSGDPKSYLAHLDQLQKKKSQRDQGLKKAKDLSGVERAKALYAVWKELQPEVAKTYYGSLHSEIKSLDPDDETGLKKAEAQEKKLTAFMEEISPLLRSKQRNIVLEKTENFITSNDFDTQALQQLFFLKLEVHYQDKNLPKALKTLEEIVTLDPKSELSKQAPRIKEDLLRLLGAEQKAAAESEKEKKP